MPKSIQSGLTPISKLSMLRWLHRWYRIINRRAFKNRLPKRAKIHIRPVTRWKGKAVAAVYWEITRGKMHSVTMEFDPALLVVGQRIARVVLLHEMMHIAYKRNEHDYFAWDRRVWRARRAIPKDVTVF